MLTRLKQTLSAFLAAAVFASCTASNLSANENVSVTGTANRPDGTPFVGATTVLVKEPDLGEAIAGIFTIALTIGLACLSATPPTICAQARTSVTDANGAFSFSMKGSDTQGSVGEASTFALATKDTPAAGQVTGASTTEQFIINVPNLPLPELKLWEPSIAFSATPSSANVTFGSVDSSYGSGATTGVTFAEADGTLVWLQAASSGQSIDARLLEDAKGNVVATANANSQAPQTSVAFYYQSAAVAFAGTAGAPPSRGAACFADATSGPVALTPCPLTDGNLGVAMTPQSEPSCSSNCPTAAPANNWAYVDLGSAKSISLVVVRGVYASCVVETSADAMTWAALPGGPNSGIFSVTASGTARYVRVRAASASDRVTGLAEISVW
jgi:hypothetical protein